MDFYDALEDRELGSLLQKTDYQRPSFSTYHEMLANFADIIQNNRRVYLYGDYDVDGLKCKLILNDALVSMGCTNIKVHEYYQRTHNIDNSAIRECIQGHYEYFIVADSGSSDLDLLLMLRRYGIKVIVLDHHMTSNDYIDFKDIVIINTTIENKINKNENFKLSAGALCYCLMESIAFDLNLTIPSYLSCYAVISLYADCMDMSNELNRALYFKARAVPSSELPLKVKNFMQEYHSFNSRFISFWYSPRINAMFRSEHFVYLNNYFFSLTNDFSVLAKCFEEINKRYEVIRELIGTISDIATVQELKHFVLFNLRTLDSLVRVDGSKRIDVDKNKLYNYTGLIANRLSNKFGKTAVVYCSVTGEIRGSLRDLQARDYLTIFQQICSANGHKPAFGFKINPLDFNDFIKSLQNIDAYYALKGVTNQPIIIPHESFEPNDILVEDMAMYNEFSGMGNLPIALIQKRLVGNMKEIHYPTSWNWKYTWGDKYYFQSDYSLKFGSIVVGKPIKSKKTKIIVQY